MKIAVGDRVRALEDCRMAGRGTSRYFYRAGDTGTAVRFDGLGAWVKWDGNRIDDGVWYASTEVLALIENEEDTSGVDVTKSLPTTVPLDLAFEAAFSGLVAADYPMLHEIAVRFTVDCDPDDEMLSPEDFRADLADAIRTTAEMLGIYSPNAESDGLLYDLAVGCWDGIGLYLDATTDRT